MLPQDTSAQIRRFRTARYSGAWFPLQSDRHATRLRIESILRADLSDPGGRLKVDHSGPEWLGNREIGLSYAHDQDSVLLVWTLDACPVGVDLEPVDRQTGHAVTELAERFFHPTESEALKLLPGILQTGAFLDLWLKKESVAKLTRKGLVYSLPLELDRLAEIEFEEPALLPLGKRAVLAFYKKPIRS